MRKGYGFLTVCGLLAAMPAAAQPLEVTITRFDCAQLLRYLPDAEVSADYEPGVDVRGAPVAPADLGGANPIELPEDFSFVIEVAPFDSAERRGLESERRVAAARLAEDPDNAALRARLDALDAEAVRLDRRPAAATTLAVGRVTVTRDGRAYFNGQPLQDEEAWELAERCREILSAPRE